jgi:hypothetical protein
MCVNGYVFLFPSVLFSGVHFGHQDTSPLIFPHTFSPPAPSPVSDDEESGATETSGSLGIKGTA